MTKWTPSAEFLAQAGYAALGALFVLAPVAWSNQVAWGLWGGLTGFAYMGVKDFTFDLWIEQASVSEGWRDFAYLAGGVLAAGATLLLRSWLIK
jgi:hypothetical protein